jgi:GNAT superfamily N-acetyltransferase/acyl carrier protein
MREKSSETAPDGGAAGSGSLRDELFAQIHGWGLDLPADLDDRSPLMASGLFDSLALFNLILWIETKTGRAIDPTQVDIAREWASIADLLQYIHRANGASGGGEVQQRRTPARAAPQCADRIVKYEPRFKHAVAQFQTGLWSPDPDLNMRYLEWKYESNPYAGEPVIYLAFHRDELVGMRGFYPSRWEAGVPARQWPVLVADDFLIREDHRNRGLATRIMETAREDLPGSNARFLFNLSGGKLTVLSSLAIGWRSIGMLRPMGLRSSGYALRRAVGLRLGRLPYLWRYANGRVVFGRAEWWPFDRLDRARTPFATKAGAVVEIDGRPRPGAMAALIERIGHDDRVRHVRDPAYFDWRFGNPLCEYRFLYVGENDLDGYLVLKRSIAGRGPAPRVSIVDLEALSDGVRAALLEAAVNAGAFSEIAVWTGTADVRLMQQLRALRFTGIDTELTALGCPCFLVRSIDNACPPEAWRLGDARLLDLAAWDIRMLFSMAG